MRDSVFSFVRRCCAFICARRAEVRDSWDEVDLSLEDLSLSELGGSKLLLLEDTPFLRSSILIFDKVSHAPRVCFAVCSCFQALLKSIFNLGVIVSLKIVPFLNSIKVCAEPCSNNF